MFNRRSNYDPSTRYESSSTLPSLTVPNMTLSLHDLLLRYVRGENVQTFQPSYVDDLDVPATLERWDASDRLLHAQSLKELRSDVLANARQRKAAEAAAAIPPRPDPEASVM